MLRRRIETYFRDRMVRNYDAWMEPFERRLFGEARRRLVPLAAGRVLEIGIGTGANVPLYPPQTSLVVGVDPEAGMVAAAATRAATRAAGRAPLALVRASAEALPFADASFDAVVATLVFCTIPDPTAALAELARVARPGARILMLEHVRSPRALVGALQDVLTPVQRVVAAGCNLNRRTQSLVERSGLRVLATRERFAAAVVEIEAVRP